MAPRDEDIEVNDAPTSINPYEVLSVEPTASTDQIKSAYRKAALKHHPDKATPDNKDAAHTKFQEIAFAYAILSDERRRKRYDTTGNTSESLDLDDDDFDWTTFFREQFKSAVTEASINKFADEYRYSEEERGHVLAAYEESKGNMDRLYQSVMLSDMAEDEERFRAIIDAAIESGEVERYKKYTGESEATRKKRVDRAKKRKEKEGQEAEKAREESESNVKAKKGGAQKKGGAEDMGDLAALIQKRQQGRSAEDFLAGLETKYSKGGKVDEPPEEAFAKNRKRAKAEEGDAKGGARSKRSRKA